MKREQSYTKGVLYVLLAELGWSLSGFFVRLLPPTLGGWQIDSWRGYWTAVALLCFLIGRHGREAWTQFRAIPIFALLISAGFFTAGSTLYVTSLTLVSTATISVIGASAPIFTGLLRPWVTGERPGLEAWAATALSLACVGIIAWDGLAGGRMLSRGVRSPA